MAANVGEVLNRIDEALQAVLPGSDYHERYSNAGSVGLALVEGEHPAFLSLEPFLAGNHPPIFSNKDGHPEAWSEEGVDYEGLIGQPKPEDLDRFEVFALAKAIHIARNPGLDQSFELEIPQGKDEVGFAGAIKVSGLTRAISGLWEVHDDFLIRYITRNQEGLQSGRMAKPQIVREIRSSLDNIARLHEGIPAANLTRPEVQRLLNRATVTR